MECLSGEKVERRICSHLIALQIAGANVYLFLFFFFPLAEFSFESLTCRYCCRGKVQNFVQWLQINLIVFILQKIFNDANAKLVLVQFQDETELWELKAEPLVGNMLQLHCIPITFDFIYLGSLLFPRHHYLFHIHSNHLIRFITVDHLPFQLP